MDCTLSASPQPQKAATHSPAALTTPLSLLLLHSVMSKTPESLQRCPSPPPWAGAVIQTIHKFHGEKHMMTALQSISSIAEVKST